MNIRFSYITTTSFVVQWDEVDHADNYTVNWRSGNGVGEKTIKSRTCTVRGLTPNTKYNVTVTTSNKCGIGTVSDAFPFITNASINLFITPISMASSKAMATVNAPALQTTMKATLTTAPSTITAVTTSGTAILKTMITPAGTCY